MAVRFLPPLAAILFLGLLLFAADRPSGEIARAEQGSDVPVYLAMGDSLAFGVGAEDPASGGYVGRTHEALRESDRYRDRGLELVNVAVPGARSADLPAPGGQLERALTATEGRRIELVSVSVGANDLLALAAADSPCAVDASGPECGREFSEVMRGLQENLTSALAQVREGAPDAGVYLVGLHNPFAGTGGTLEALAELGVQQVNGVIATVAADAEPGVEMVEVFDHFQARGQEWIAGDGLHPSDDGHRVISALLLGAIEGREAEIPPDLAVEPPPDATVDPQPDAPSGDGGTNVLLIIALPVAFLAGAALSAAYFLARGR
jgi:lysophospholipase L1-like esterase